MDSKDVKKILEIFVSEIKKTNIIYLLQAYDGMFAMIEDEGGQEYLPIWNSKDIAESNISDDWKDYSLQEMPVNEFKGWLPDLDSDEIKVAIYLNDGNVITLKPKDIISYL
jgi:hypothetical protein